MKTKAPSSMKRLAAARPIPVAPPVITAVFPFSLVMTCIPYPVIVTFYSFLTCVPGLTRDIVESQLRVPAWRRLRWRVGRFFSPASASLTLLDHTVNKQSFDLDQLVANC